MTRSTLPPAPEVPESTVSELHALYREAARDEPAPSLDRLILDAARAELKADQATQSMRPAAWWKGWLPVTSAIAVALVGLSVTWRVMDEQERHLREEAKAAEGLRERSGMTAGSTAPAQAAAEARPLLSAPVPAAEKSRRAESAVAKDASLAVPEPPAMPARAAPAAMAPAPAAMPAPAAPAAMAAPQAMKKTQSAEMDGLQERRDAGAAADSASGPARQGGKAEAGSLGASGATAAETLARPSANSSAKSLAAPAAQSAADPATPEAWLKHIRELRAAGRSAEAAQSLVRFRARYPDLLLPEDLLNLK